MNPERIIHSDDCVAEGAACLARREPRFAYALEQTGPLPLRLKPDGFAPLLNAIVSQQVSVASAAAIWGRLQGAGLTTPGAVLAMTQDEMRTLGMSRQKARYAHALADAQIDYDVLRDMPSDRAIKRLVDVSGIGAWTAEIYVMFSLGRADVFAPGDLALQESARLLFDLPERPKDRDLRQMAQKWAPWRSVAARILWAYYRVATRNKGLSD